MWLVGAGYWGSKIESTLKKFNVDAKIIDIKNGQTIDDITDTGPVMLATPLWNHYEQCKILLSRGHDVYVEKPMAETVKKILDLKSLCKTNQIFMVGHLFQHHPQRNEIHTLVDTGFIGKVTHISSRRLNWGIYQTKTDPVLSLGTHDISIVLDFTSGPVTVDASQCYRTTNGSKPDRVTWAGRSGDVTFDCEVSWAWPVRTRETIIIGTKGQIVWNQDSNQYTITHNRIENNRAIVDEFPQVVKYSDSLTPLEHEIKHWIDCIQTRSQPTTGIDQALNVARVIDQINIS